jgi:EAL domain-containing protein (putative c-di-GMP-specific phosphodiesterase class I)
MTLTTLSPPDTDAQASRFATIAAVLAQAKFDDEFHLVFQPQIMTRSAQVFAVEVLLRWQSPILGNVSVAEFIPVAEQCGLIHRITRWVIRQALRFLGRWQRQGVHLHMAVNISARDLEHSELMEEIRIEIEANQVEASQFMLEVTETAPLRYPTLAARNALTLREAGCAVALDDFGSGYADLWHLGCLPLSEVKIDKSLVQSLRDEAFQVLVCSTIALAHALNMTVVAEGVDNAFAVRFLQRAGCDYLQGFYFSAPLNEAQLLGWLAQRA